MNGLDDCIGKCVSVELSGNKSITGQLLESGLDILAIHRYEDRNVYYIPLGHIQNISPCTYLVGSDAAGLPEPYHPFQAENEAASFRKVLQSARGHFVEIYVSGNATIHGYLTSVMNDYFIFHSPVYKTVFVTLTHLKWLMPYREDVTPYALDSASIPHRSIPTSLPRTFKEQCRKLVGSLVVFDMGDHPDKIGLLKSIDVDSNLAEVFIANGSRRHLNLTHLKTVYLP